MKIGIISDTQGNIYAFKEALRSMGEQGVDLKVHLGDIVGFCPNPNECVDLTVANFNYIVKGDTDQAVIDSDSVLGLTPLVSELAQWTSDELEESNKEIIDELSFAHTVGDIVFSHSSPNPNVREIKSLNDAEASFVGSTSDFAIAFVGDSKRPRVWVNRGKDVFDIKPRFEANQLEESTYSYFLNEEERVIVDVGSVGNPKDGDSRLSYVIYDTDEASVTFYRTPYRVDKVVGKMQQKGFNNKSWQKMMYGQ